MTTTEARPYPGNPVRTHADGPERDAILDGLQAAVDYLRAHPEVEVRRWGYILAHSPQDGASGVQRHARMFGVKVETQGGTCRAARNFGPVSLMALAAGQVPA